MLGQGREAAKVFLRENPKLRKEIMDGIWKAAKTAKVPVAVGKEEAD
jgi:hypothetical protein